jgi:spermidine synthase
VYTAVPVRWLFVVAYTCSGLAGLIYEVSWTRLLTLYIGHTTAAASAVVAAFLGGLAVGAAAGGRMASRWSRQQSLYAYILLEIGVIAVAFTLPFELSLLTPFLASAYNDGAGVWMFPTARVAVCLMLVFVPAVFLGATFPMAIRWFASEEPNAPRASGVLYAANTVGAAMGALLAGFVLIPTIGLAWTTGVGMAASAVAAAAAAVLLPRDEDSAGPAAPIDRKTRGTERARGPAFPLWVAPAILGLSGFAALMHEIVWMRILSLLLGPTIYAFSATLAAVVAGVAIGSGLGAWIVGRTRHAAGWLACTLAGAAVSGSYTCSLAGTAIPSLVAREVAAAPGAFDALLRQGLFLTAALITPISICLGAAFPLALALAGDARERVARRYALVYAVNTIGAVSGSLAAGFLAIPLVGLETSLQVVTVCLIAASLIVAAGPALRTASRIGALLASAAAAAILVLSPPWDRELLASGVYMYAPFVPKDLDLNTLLKAGTLLYYREGAAATVSVKRLTGTMTLAVDGKTDASNRGDMLTQKLVAHLPLLLHENPRAVAIVGLGSGVTLGSALRHPMARADVLEISPEVVEASRFFDDENHHALDDARANLIVGDGRSHLLLSRRRYDVIISEPSNPWIAGVAALFTREFFLAARGRLAPGGIICQWANVYNISEHDLRSIVATFISVFPEGTAWLVGPEDVLLIASTGSLDDRLANIERHWTRPSVAEDLALVSALQPFSLLSLFVAGPRELARYSAGAGTFSDDRMTLEFSAPRQIHAHAAGANGAALAALIGPEEGPAAIRRAHASAGPREWRSRGAMMAKRDAYATAYEDYVRALRLDPADAAALDGLVRAAILTSRQSDALVWIKSLAARHGETAETLVAASKLLASSGAHADALEAARRAASLPPVKPIALEQLASLYADAGDTVQLDAAVARLREVAPERAATRYYAAAGAFLHGRVDEAVELALGAVSIDPAYAPVYDLLGAAFTKRGDPAKARDAFAMSLRLDAHDSTAYTNLGLLELAADNRREAANYFAEALWLVPDSPVAREGLAQASARQ